MTTNSKQSNLRDYQGGILRLVKRLGDAQSSKPLQYWLDTLCSGAQERWHLECAFETGGPWAGVQELFAALLPQLRADCPKLVERHDYELLSILPELRKSLKPRFATLTDLAPPNERVRLYPADRALRIVHGLIDLLTSFKSHCQPGLWVIICMDFDRSGILARSFFSHLIRRRGRQLQLVLITVEHERAQDPGNVSSSDVPSLFPYLPLDTIYVAPDSNEATQATPENTVQDALALESSVAHDENSLESRLPSLIAIWDRVGQLGPKLKWQCKAFTLATQRGYYADALRYVETILKHFQEFCGTNDQLRWYVVVKSAACYCALNKPEMALTLIEQEALQCMNDARCMALAHYTIAMLYARYLPAKDFARAEHHLNIGLDQLVQAELPNDEFCFESVFNRNGLAFIRHRQGDHDEAIQLCRAGLTQLEEHLGQDQHRLHRSVLRYNIAQVYAASGNLEEAWHQYTKAMTMDVNYSEYYNERGNVLFKLGRLDDAICDYERAKALSPPYPEVFSNLGQCFRLKGQFDDATTNFEIALDLDPRQSWVWIMKAECLEAKNNITGALQDYDIALQLDSQQPLLLGNRARLRYQIGLVTEALKDLDDAITLSPNTADLHQNRAVALLSLGQYDEATRSFEAYLNLDPHAPDRSEIEATLASIEAGTINQRW